VFTPQQVGTEHSVFTPAATQEAVLSEPVEEVPAPAEEGTTPPSNPVSAAAPVRRVVKPILAKTPKQRRQHRRRFRTQVSDLWERYSGLFRPTAKIHTAIQNLLRLIDPDQPRARAQPETTEVSRTREETKAGPLVSVRNVGRVEPVRFRTLLEKVQVHEAGMRHLARWWRRYGCIYTTNGNADEVAEVLSHLESLLFPVSPVQDAESDDGTDDGPDPSAPNDVSGAA
jgi:hypothetical protein